MSRRKAVAPAEPVERSRRHKTADDAMPGSSTDADVADEEDQDNTWSFTQTQGEPCVDEESLTPKEDPKYKASLGPDEIQSLVVKMTRYLFLKGCACEPVLKSKLAEEVLGDQYKKVRGLGHQVFVEASASLKAVFGFKVVKAPSRHFPQPKFKDAHYVINDLTNSRLRGDVLQNEQPALRALLMTLLAFCYSSNHNSKSHRVGEAQLIAHLDKLDPASTKASRLRDFGHSDWVDLIEVFVKQHYFVREKDAIPGSEDRVNVLGFGPRAFLEVGRKQVLFFTHEAVGMKVDQSLIDELNDGEPKEGGSDAEE